MDPSRRQLISGDWLKRAAAAANSDDATVSQNYFDSFESCYPLLATAGPLLIDEAHALGIATEGKSREVIAREVFERGFRQPDKDAKCHSSKTREQ